MVAIEAIDAMLSQARLCAWRTGVRKRRTRVWLHSIAFHALDHAYNVGYFVCGAAAAVSFVLAAVALGGGRQEREAEPERPRSRAPETTEAAPHGI
jgi:uncharacterized membrane protein YhfC